MTTKSDLSVIESDVIRDALCQTVESRLKSKNYKICVSSASQAGESNFIGIVYRVSYCKDDEDVNGPNASKLILKIAPSHPSRREKFTTRLPFLQEIYMYDVVLPSFRKFEQSKGLIVEKDGFFEYPECYRTVDVDLSECLFLEDLKQRSFNIIDKSKEQLTADHVNLVLRALGKYHAISMALRDQKPEQFKELTSNLLEVFFQNDDDTFRDYFNKQAHAALDTVSSEEDIHLHTKLKKFLSKDVIDILLDTLNLNEIGSGVVISHADTWQNNILYRHDQNGKPTDCSILDWQISRCASPIHDIVYFVFCCTTKELRDIHYDNFLRNYHESLSAHIRRYDFVDHHIAHLEYFLIFFLFSRLGSDPDQLFPFELMQEHFHKFARYGLLMSTTLLPMITGTTKNLFLQLCEYDFNTTFSLSAADKGNVVDMDEMFEDLNNGKEIDSSVFVSEASRNRLNKRLRDVIVDMVRLNYI